MSNNVVFFLFCEGASHVCMYILNSSLIITDTVAGDLQTIVTAYFLCKPLTMFALYCNAVNNIYTTHV